MLRVSIFPRSMRIVLGLWVVCGSIVEASAWERKEIKGRGYVSLESVKAFYQFNKLTRQGKSITLEKSNVRMVMGENSRECTMNTMKFIFSEPVVVHVGEPWISEIDLTKLVDPVLRPNFIRSAGNFRTVVLDPGHGGKDAGATNVYGTEAGYNLKVAKRVKRLLERQGFKVVMTREGDRYLSLQQRVNIANRVKDDAVFVSIHHNSAKRKEARGIETFTLSPVGVSHYGSDLKASDYKARKGNTHDSANVALASAIHSRLLLGLKHKPTGRSYTVDRGIKRARFSVLSGVQHPSVLVECGFMSNGYEAKLIEDPGYQERVASAIVKGITAYRAVVGRK